MKALVTGGTGTLGRLVVPRLRDAGWSVRVLTRRSNAAADDIEFFSGDLATGDGIEAAVAGTDIIIHAAGTGNGDGSKARHLVEAASRVGTQHLVFISVVGADQVPVTSWIDRALFGYFESKLAAERIVSDSRLPWTALRSTQFQQSMLQLVEQMTKLLVVPVPAGWRFQPIDAGEVADRLVELALGTPSGLVPDIAGPQIYEMTELVRTYLRARGKHRLILPVGLPGKANRVFRGGANLSPDRAIGRRTWEDVLGRASGPNTREDALTAPR
jgi:uncharacterized protein YbjT (DUF2867 family)